MDGTSSTVLANATWVTWPNALTIDYANQVSELVVFKLCTLSLSTERERNSDKGRKSILVREGEREIVGGRKRNRERERERDSGREKGKKKERERVEFLKPTCT